MFQQKKVSTMLKYFFLGLVLVMNTLINVHAYQDEVVLVNGGRKVLNGHTGLRKLEEISRAPFGPNIDKKIEEISKISGVASSDHYEGKSDFNGKSLGDIHHKTRNSDGDYDDHGFVAFHDDYNGMEIKASTSLGKAQESLSSKERIFNIDQNIEIDDRKLKKADKEIASLMHRDYTDPVRRTPPINNNDPYH